MIVLVTGGRFYANKAKVFATLDLIHQTRPITRVVHGAATGADEFGCAWAIDRCVDECGTEPDWRRYDNYAGNVRNQRMLDENQVDLVVAFPGGPGTRDMRARSEKAAIPILRIK